MLPRPIIRSTRPSARCWSIAKSSAIFTGSLVVMRVVEVERISFSVLAAIQPSIVVGDDGTNGGLWCSPVAKTSRPTSSAFCAMATMALMRSCSVGVRPVVGSGVTSPTLKIPNCMVAHPPQVVYDSTIPANGTRHRLFPHPPPAPPHRPPAVSARPYDPDMAAPRRDTRGIVDATELFSRVRFRRREPAPPLRPYLEHYWLIDWDLPQPYASHVVPHPSVNVVFQKYEGQDPFVRGRRHRARPLHPEAGGAGPGVRHPVPAGRLPPLRPGTGR